jgi:uncharacterized membrane protein
MEEEQDYKPRPRIEALSDIVFGLALSIGALTLIGQELTSFQGLLNALGLYAFSFLILVSVWLSYSTLTSILPAETETLRNLNIMLLFFVSIEPFLFNQLFARNGAMFNDVSIIYTLDLAAMFLILAFFNHNLINHVPKDQSKNYKFTRNFSITIVIFLLFSALPFFEISYFLPLRVYIWIVVLILGWIRRILSVHSRPIQS